MFERFTEKAITTIMLAQEEGRRLGHPFVGTEYILLGLVGNNGNPAREILLSKSQFTLKDYRIEVEKIVGRGNGFIAVDMPFTPRAKRALELSWEVAYNLGHNKVECLHLLLGLLKENGGVAVRVLENLGLDLEVLEVQTYNKFLEPNEAKAKSKKLVYILKGKAFSTVFHSRELAELNKREGMEIEEAELV